MITMNSMTTEIVPGRDVAVPDPQTITKPTRRQYPAAYKARIVKEYRGLTKGEKGALMRREGLRNQTIRGWIIAVDEAAEEALGRQVGRPGKDPVAVANEELTARVSELEAELDTANRVIEVQGKLSALLDHLASNRATRNPSE